MEIVTSLHNLQYFSHFTYSLISVLFSTVNLVESNELLDTIQKNFEIDGVEKRKKAENEDMEIENL